MNITSAIARVRRDIGDPPTNFQTTALTDGLTLLFELPKQNVNPVGLLVQYINTSQVVTVLQPSSSYAAWSSITAYTVGQLVTASGYYFHCLVNNTNVAPNSNGTASADWTPDIAYTLDSIGGSLNMSSAIPNNYTLTVTGQAWGLFTDEEVEQILHDSAREHAQGQHIIERYKSAQGFIQYRRTPVTIHNIPHREQSLLITLADINCLWILATDAATDVSVNTSEGTTIDRSARYSQLMEHIQMLTEKYERYCGEWNVGMYRMESLNLRRVSRTNNRLVPLFTDREYDDHEWPVRQLPQIDTRDEDGSGVPSPLWNGNNL
jgi:hypothetical protein